MTPIEQLQTSFANLDKAVRRYRLFFKSNAGGGDPGMGALTLDSLALTLDGFDLTLN